MRAKRNEACRKQRKAQEGKIVAPPSGSIHLKDLHQMRILTRNTSRLGNSGEKETAENTEKTENREEKKGKKGKLARHGIGPSWTDLAKAPYT